MLEELKKEVYEANMLLPKYGLVIFTWGNVSSIDKETGLVVIKPSGVEYDKLRVEDMVVTDLDGNVVEGNLKPSSDLKSHLELYKNFKDIGSIVHTHSTYATSFAQANKDIPVLGTTHGDYFYGDIPCTRKLTKQEIDNDYELNTGLVIVEEFKQRGIDYHDIPAALLPNHGPFVWGKDTKESIENSVVLEEIAKMAINSMIINKDVEKMNQDLLDKHFKRKHGPNAYYGQK